MSIRCSVNCTVVQVSTSTKESMDSKKSHLLLFLPTQLLGRMTSLTAGYISFNPWEENNT